jgi:branched-chain amino acid transport system ATP-binding protein
MNISPPASAAVREELSMPEPRPILQTIDLTKSFGMVKAADTINVQITQGELVGIVGANGSGKTTFLNLITGYLRPDHGRILIRDQESTGLPPRRIIKLGLARSFQIPQLYTGLSVLENMLLSLAAQAGKSTGFWKPLYRRQWMQEGRDVLERFGLTPYAHRSVAELPEGGRKLLDVALSFALKPQLLLMDEPTSGVSIEDKFQVMDTLVGVLQQSAITTIFVEHDMEVVQRYSQRVLVFDNGEVIADGNPNSVLAMPEVRRSVLGRE